MSLLETYYQGQESQMAQHKQECYLHYGYYITKVVC